MGCVGGGGGVAQRPTNAEKILPASASAGIQAFVMAMKMRSFARPMDQSKAHACTALKGSENAFSGVAYAADADTHVGLKADVDGSMGG